MLHRSACRALAACAALALAASADAADPSSGTLTPDARTLTFTGGPFPIPNVTPQLYVEGVADPVCSPGEGVVCDSFALTLDLPDDFYTTNPQDMVKITMTWPQSNTGAEDYDFYLYDSDGNIVNGGEGTTNPESMSFCAGQGKQEYSIVIYPFSAVLDSYEASVELVTESRARCKAPKAASETKDASFGGALGLALLPLALAALRRRAR